MTSPSSTPARGVVTAPCQQREAHACSQVFTCVHRMRSTDMATMNAPPSALNTETTIALSQSMDSVNTTPEEEVSDECLLHYCVVFIILSVRPSVRPSVCLSALPSVRLSVLSVRPSVRLSVLSVRPSVRLSHLTRLAGR